MSEGTFEPGGGVVTARDGGRSSGTAEALGTDDGLGLTSSSSSSSILFFAFAVGLGDERFLRLVLGASSSSSLGVGDFAGDALPLPFFLAAFGFPDGLGDSDGVGELTVCISSRAFRNASRFFLSASEICAWRTETTNALSATMHPSQMPNDLNPPRRDNTDESFKPAVVQPWLLRHAVRRARVRGSGSR